MRRHVPVERHSASDADQQNDVFALNVVHGTWHKMGKGRVSTKCGKDTSVRHTEWVLSIQCGYVLPGDTHCKRCFK